jgi:hypothetical protein
MNELTNEQGAPTVLQIEGAVDTTVQTEATIMLMEPMVCVARRDVESQWLCAIVGSKQRVNEFPKVSATMLIDAVGVNLIEVAGCVPSDNELIWLAEWWYHTTS